MTNKEKYKQAFSGLHPLEPISLEVEQMVKIQKKHKFQVAAAILTAFILVGGTGTVYAANIGGIQRTIQLWIHGDQTDATLDVKEDGSYSLNYSDENGKEVEQGGGGVAFDADGTERPLTEEEIMEQINMPEVEYEEDESIWVYYENQKIEITDKFDNDKVCYVKIKGKEKTLYLTVKYQNGYCISEDKYPSPASFN